MFIIHIGLFRLIGTGLAIATVLAVGHDAWGWWL